MAGPSVRSSNRSSALTDVMVRMGDFCHPEDARRRPAGEGRRGHRLSGGATTVNAHIGYANFPQRG